MPDLRKGQYRRLGRIAENNPERAQRVAERMNKRASRVDRGKEVAGDGENGIGRGVAKLYTGSGSAQEDMVIRRHSMQAEEHRPNSSHEQARKRDTPLSMTPEPIPGEGGGTKGAINRLMGN